MGPVESRTSRNGPASFPQIKLETRDGNTNLAWLSLAPNVSTHPALPWGSKVPILGGPRSEGPSPSSLLCQSEPRSLDGEPLWLALLQAASPDSLLGWPWEH